MAWSIINDHYMTDLPLLYAPHIIALAAILLALTIISGQGGGQQASHSSANSIASAAQAALQAAGNPKATQSAEKTAKIRTWLAESNIDVAGIVDCTQELISFYDCQEQYNEKLVREQINRFVKARGLDK